MRRLALLLWWLVPLAVWLILGHVLAWTFLHISWNVPLWLQRGTEWTLRKIEHNPLYYPDDYDVEGALSLLLFVIAYLFATAIVAPASMIMWQRLVYRKKLSSQP